MSTTTCRAEYVRPGGRQRGDRIVRCHLPAGHPGEHEEADTEITWTEGTNVAEYTPDPADVELVRNAWRNAPCPTCVEPRSWAGRGRNCRCVLDDDELRDYRARAVLSALADAGRLRAAGRKQAADPPEWLIEILHVAWAFARREHEGRMVALVPEHARAALADVPTEVLRAARITEGSNHAD